MYQTSVANIHRIAGRTTNQSGNWQCKSVLQGRKKTTLVRQLVPKKRNPKQLSESSVVWQIIKLKIQLNLIFENEYLYKCLFVFKFQKFGCDFNLLKRKNKTFPAKNVSNIYIYQSKSWDFSSNADCSPNICPVVCLVHNATGALANCNCFWELLM
mgnify:CR=1 FL=1